MSGDVERQNYERGAQLLWEIVRDWKGEPPRFAFPPKEVALLADLRDVGLKLARNDAARDIVERAIQQSIEATGQAPTAMMLRVVLEVAHIPIECVPLDELQLGVVGLIRGNPKT